MGPPSDRAAARTYFGQSAAGDVLAMVGSADYLERAIDGAVNVALAHRQPGSAIKPIT